MLEDVPESHPAKQLAKLKDKTHQCMWEFPDGSRCNKLIHCTKRSGKAVPFYTKKAAEEHTRHSEQAALASVAVYICLCLFF